MLSVTDLDAGYGPAQVLFGVSFGIADGEVVALMGRNGMGKTTTVRAITGLLRPRAGTIRFADRDLAGAPPHRIAQAGIGLVPEGRQIFPTLSVEENLLVAARSGPWTLARITTLFPRLAERRHHRGTQLSGGEQQMLAIGRALMTNPSLIILDEATEGLAPLIRAEIFACLATLRAEGQSILVIDKDIAALGILADRVLMLEKGRVVWEGSAAMLRADHGIAERYLRA